MCNRFSFEININVKDILLNMYVDLEFFFCNVRKIFYSYYIMDIYVLFVNSNGWEVCFSLFMWIKEGYMWINVINVR